MNSNVLPPDQPCPCGSGRSLHDCCGLFILHGQHAATAEQLMRSRYTAYVLGEADYLLRTWHHSTRPATAGGLRLRWFHLAIIAVEHGAANDQNGVVEFIASYAQPPAGKRLHERSNFIQDDGRWYYLDGRVELTALNRNEPCPCGSGTKFKRCCAVLAKQR